MEEHFDCLIEKTADCWLWSGSKDKDGYGIYHVCRVTKKSHRIAWEIAFGEIPKGLCVLHRCDNPACVRPDHLFLGTHADNVRDKHNKGRQGKGNTSIPDETVRKIIAMRKETGATFMAIGSAFGISHSQASRIFSGRSRKKDRG
jgi:hypothetical protein